MERSRRDFLRSVAVPAAMPATWTAFRRIAKRDGFVVKARVRALASHAKTGLASLLSSHLQFARRDRSCRSRGESIVSRSSETDSDLPNP